MKSISFSNKIGAIFLVLLHLIGVVATVSGQPQFSLSDGIYRLPYLDGTSFVVWGSHYEHSPQGAYDLHANGSGDHFVVAAGDGIIRGIQDGFDNSCGVTTACNNYVWIEHPNGEWSKYSHMRKNSVTNNGWSLNESICAGDLLGIEDDIGKANGVHLHFEVGVPFDPANAFTQSGGFMGAANPPLGVYKIPVFCGVSGDTLADNANYTANPCVPGECLLAEFPANETWNNGQHDVNMALFVTNAGPVTFNSGSAGLYQAAAEVTLTEGFRAKPGSDFVARLGNCNVPPWGSVSPCQNGLNGSELAADRGDSFLKNTPAGQTEFTVKTWPIPFEHTLHVDFFLPEKSNRLSALLLDVSGRILQVAADQNALEPGFFSIQLTMGDLPPGIYFLHYQANGMTGALKLAK